MKKLFFTLCALCLCGTMLATPTSSTYWADDSRPTNASGGIYQDMTSGLSFYVNSDGNAVITYINDSYDTSSETSLDKSSWTSGYETTTLTSLVIPEYVSDGTNQYPVTVIGRLAFFKATNFQGSLTVPSYITELGSNAFENCSNITEVTIEYSATALKDDANQLYGSSFWNCTSIATVYLNRNVTEGRSGNNYFVTPFNQLTSITTLYVGENVTSIPIYMFYHCTNLATVYCYAATVPSLGKDVFTGISETATLHVCKSLLSDYQSSDWNNYFTSILNDLDDPDLEEGTYKDLTTGLYFEINEDGKTASIYHDELGVYDDNNLVSHSTITGAYTLPETVSADGETYYNVTRVEASAFEGSSISGHIVIPANILYMGQNAFKGCTGIETVTYEYSPTALTEENATSQSGASFHDCSNITTVNWYRNIVTTYSVNQCQQPGPFSDLGTVETLNIGPRVTELLRYAFRKSSNATAMTTINCYAAVPPTVNTNAFGVLPTNCVVSVPQGSTTAYQASSWLTEYSSLTIQEMSNAYAVDITLTNNDGYYYATYYNSNAVDIYPEGGTENVVTSYAVSGVTVEDEEEGYLDLAEVGATVPAQTAVLVEATAEGTYTIIETTAAGSASYTGTNDLYGYDEATEVTDDSSYYYYTLSHPSGGGSLGFYWATSDGSATSFTSAAHKAYLMLLKLEVVNLKSISLRKGDGGGDTTGITSVEVENEAKAVKGIYTVQGVRVSNMNQPGLYIVDGKKVLVK